ncbi:uncharacterized protein [Aristolochia californica]|uniref:uncharacterized protein isoform X2 n=1 Tax=Aristolochia californica TaxID=171875 RepID=UPI0035DF0ACA
MVALPKRARRTLETPATPRVSEESLPYPDVGGGTSGYEQLRDERIKENLERMQKLGILDLSRKLKSEVQSRKLVYRNQTEKRSPLVSSPAGPTRRSSRLQNLTPVSYVEVGQHGRVQEFPEGGEDFIKEGRKPEIYTEEHDKLLGTCEAIWELFKDGYDSTGKRIYDPVKGKTCHQCRQKTLGYRTHCRECNIVQGQLCGDCLYMRYGEHVLEAKRNPNWICPVCRGICNCSLCRIKKGWAPTGPLYRKTTSAEPVSAKRSLPFGDTDGTSQQGKLTKEDNDASGCLKPVLEDTGDKICDIEEPNMDDECDSAAQIAGEKCYGEVHSKVEMCGGDCSSYENSTGNKKVQNISLGTPIITVENEGKPKQEFPSSNEKSDGKSRSSEEMCDEEVQSADDKNDGGDCSYYEKITGDKKVQKVDQGTPIVTVDSEGRTPKGVAALSSDQKDDMEVQSKEEKHDGGDCISHEKVQNKGAGTPVVIVEREGKPKGRKPKRESISTMKKRAADRLPVTAESIAGRLRKRPARH